MTEEATILSRQYADLLRAGGCSERTIDNYLYAIVGSVHRGTLPVARPSGRFPNQACRYDRSRPRRHQPNDQMSADAVPRTPCTMPAAINAADRMPRTVSARG